MLSPELKNRAAQSHCQWLLSVYYLRDANLLLITKLEEQLTGQVYPPLETIAWQDALRNVSSGLISRDGKPMSTGAYWGEDLILKNSHLKIRTPCHSLTFVEVLEIRRPEFFQILEAFPDQHRAVRKQSVKLCLARGIVHLARCSREKCPLPWMKGGKVFSLALNEQDKEEVEAVVEIDEVLCAIDMATEALSKALVSSVSPLA